MKAVIQRVKSASVTVEGKLISEIGNGLLVLIGVGTGDSTADSDYIAKKLAGMRIFSDDADKMNLSVKDIGGSILLVSQFTLYGDAKHGNRPGFTDAMEPVHADELFERVVSDVAGYGIDVKKGVFGAHMMIGMEGDGPVTILLETEKHA